ncbi:MAG: DNA gyrase subunit A, partial [Planctomycetes bacterium]|nr:DNA gyrase subunit A [Planctomycetota bacterium]
SDARPMGRTTAGVKGITLREGDEVVDIAVVNRSATLLTVCSNGYGKRTPFTEYRQQKRGGKGLINIKATERNGHVVAAKSLYEGDEIMMMTRNGTVIRTEVTEKSIRSIGRNTQGVRLMKVDAGDEIVSVVKIMNEDAELEKNEARHADDIVDALAEGGLDALEERGAAKSKRRKAAPPPDDDEDGEEE